MDHIRAHHPDAVLLENLPALAQEVPDSDETDAAFITRSLKEAGYGIVDEYLVAAESYGSKAARKRLFWLAVLGPPSAEKVSVMRGVFDTTKLTDTDDEESWSAFWLQMCPHRREVDWVAVLCKLGQANSQV